MVPNPWTNRPKRTVMKYFPSWPMTSARDSISRILAVIKKKTPMGESLKFFEVSLGWEIISTNLNSPNDPSCNDHHSFTKRHQKVLDRLASLTHFSNCSSKNDAEHDETQNVHSFLVLSFDLEHLQWNCWQRNFKKRYFEVRKSKFR